MTSANDLGQIANQPGSTFRSRINANIQACASFHYGTNPPDPVYPNLLWFDQASGRVRLRDPQNTVWADIGIIGPPFKWTAIDVPETWVSTGDLKPTLKTLADPGWVMMNDGSIGNASSGATAHAHADAAALFALIWANIANTWAPLQNASGVPVSRGASAASDWAANRRLVLPKALGRALSLAGWGAGLTARALGEVQGEEAHTLSIPEMPAHNHTGSTGDAGAHTHTESGFDPAPGYHGAGEDTIAVGAAKTTSQAPAHHHTIAAQGSGQPHNTMQPSFFVNIMVKL
ncbi:MAG: hypothetical protein P9C48_14410 [Defluviicoccus sp.]|nr:hypothetical protein [Defluviicoccus sp.]MDG4610312.1 hypothetical protein [Defluviicoccus sp.]